MSKYLAKLEFETKFSGYYTGISLWEDEDVKNFKKELQISKNLQEYLSFDVYGLEVLANEILSSITINKISNNEYEFVKQYIGVNMGILTPNDVVDVAYSTY